MVSYDADWLENWDGQSIERVHLDRPAESYDNWVCADHPSPGMPNATAFQRRTRAPHLAVGPVPFTPNSDGQDDYLKISAELPPGTEAAVTILEFSGRIIRQIPLPADGTYLWDGKTESGAAAQTGPFFVVAEFEFPDGSKTIRKRGILWR